MLRRALATRYLRSGPKPDYTGGPNLRGMAERTEAEPRWIAVRCVFLDKARSAYEERITLWHASSVDDAIACAEAEADAYASDLDDTTYVGLAQAFRLFGEPGHGAEVFSLIRASRLPADDYLSAFFDTGTERQSTT
jgi:hypothetical protein